MRCSLLESHSYIAANGQYRMCCTSTEPDNVENVHTHTQLSLWPAANEDVSAAWLAYACQAQWGEFAL